MTVHDVGWAFSTVLEVLFFPLSAPAKVCLFVFFMFGFFFLCGFIFLIFTRSL